MAADYHLEIDGAKGPIKGESQDAKFKDQIQIETFSWGATQQGAAHAGGGAGAGKVNFHDISFTKKADKATAKLLEACATGEHLKKAILHVRKAGGKAEEYYKISMFDALVSSIQASGHSGGDALPMESLSINFSKFELEYKEQGAAGNTLSTTSMKFDLKQGKTY